MVTTMMMMCTMLMGLLWTMTSQLTGLQQVHGRTLNCRLRCVVLDDGDNWLKTTVAKIWEELRSLKKVNGLDLQIIEGSAESNFSIDGLLSTHMAVGSPNATCLIGPYTRGHVMAAAKLNMMYFMTTEPHEDFLQWSEAVSIFPRTKIFCTVVKELVLKFNWTSLAILYDTNEGLMFIEDLVRLPTIVVRAWRVPPNAASETFRSILKEVRRSSAVVSVLLHKSQTFLNRALDLALQLGMHSTQYKWIAPFLDVSEFETAKISETGVVLYALGLRTRRSEPHATLEYSIAHDALLVVYQCVRQFHRMTGNCRLDRRDVDLHALLSQIDGFGTTGRLTFDEHGMRRGSEISILSLQAQGFQEIGFWNASIKEPGRRLRLLHAPPAKTPSTTDSHEPLRIVSIQEPPFMMNKASRSPGLSTKYEGFCIDLLDELSVRLGLSFDVYLVIDNQYGRKLADGSWNGMIRQIIDRVVNFTDPFCTVDVEAIGRAPTSRSPKVRITDPLAPQVWVSLLAITTAISVVLYFFDRLAAAAATAAAAAGTVEGVPPGSAEWRRETPPPATRCGVWFTLAAVLLGGVTAVGARSGSNAGRILVSVVWIFAAAVVSLYTAKMAAIMATSELQTASNRRLEDLLGQRDVSFGTARHSDVSWLLERSSNPKHVRMWQIMAEHDLPGSVDMFQQSLSDVTDNQEDGFRRVRRAANRNYHFVWHAPGVRFHAAEDCDLVALDSELDRLAFGIAVPPDSPWLDALNQALKTLREQGTLQRLENKWWGAKGCSTSFHRPHGVSLEDLTGLLIILAVTVVISTVISVLEHNFCRQKIEKKRNRRIPAKHSAVISACDGVPSPNTVQMEEPFLPLNASAGGQGSTASRQTQIF